MPSTIFRGGDPGNKENWLECIPFGSKDKDLPCSVQFTVGINIIDLIKSITVLDAQSEEGFRVLKTRELTKDMVIIDVELNEKSIAKIVGSQGADSNAIILIDPDGHTRYTRLGWYESHGGKDGLAAYAALCLQRVNL
jgi:hypothetical protein